mmetsp:Transcript_39413/g.118015  ORF Transcript_39413/g.118015 Transcript_39413/m.118015 type:complete len:211 (-) Transcript_39413:301-933(-)
MVIVSDASAPRSPNVTRRFMPSSASCSASAKSPLPMWGRGRIRKATASADVSRPVKTSNSSLMACFAALYCPFELYSWTRASKAAPAPVQQLASLKRLRAAFALRSASSCSPLRSWVSARSNKVAACSFRSPLSRKMLSALLRSSRAFSTELPRSCARALVRVAAATSSLSPDFSANSSKPDATSSACLAPPCSMCASTMRWSAFRSNSA